MAWVGRGVVWSGRALAFSGHAMAFSGHAMVFSGRPPERGGCVRAAAMMMTIVRCRFATRGQNEPRVMKDTQLNRVCVPLRDKMTKTNRA